jgi:preprotein translocase subunit SecA
LFEDETFNTIRDKNNKIDLFKFIDIINSIWFNIIDKKLKIEDLKNKTEENLIKIVKKFLFDGYENMRQNIIDNLSEEELYSIEKDIVLKTFDENWQLHIEKMTKLRISSSMASYAQQNPYQVYVEKGSEHFAELLKRISHNTIKLIMSNYYGRKDLVIDSQE